MNEVIALEAGPFVFAHKGNGQDDRVIGRKYHSDKSHIMFAPSSDSIVFETSFISRSRWKKGRNIVGRAAQITMMDGDIERSSFILLLSCLKHNIRNFRNYLTLSHFRSNHYILRVQWSFRVVILTSARMWSNSLEIIWSKYILRFCSYYCSFSETLFKVHAGDLWNTGKFPGKPNLRQAIMVQLSYIRSKDYLPFYIIYVYHNLSLLECC